MPACPPQKENLTSLERELLLLYAQQTKTASDDKFRMNPIVHAHPSPVGPSVDIKHTYVSHLRCSSSSKLDRDSICEIIRQENS